VKSKQTLGSTPKRGVKTPARLSLREV
jgi:hypothetical protein